MSRANNNQVNDLPLDRYCQEISMELDIITSSAPPSSSECAKRKDNLILYPLSMSGYDSWGKRSLEEIRDALKAKTIASMHRKSCDVDVDFEGNLVMERGSAAKPSSLPNGK